MSDATQPMSKPRSVVQWGLIAVLAALVAIAAVPSYLSGQWPWSADLPVPHLEAMRSLINTPLAVPGWEATLQQEVGIGRDRWSLAEYRRPGNADSEDERFVLLLLPQMGVDQQPEVEWVDLRGAWGWQVADQHTVRFTTDDPAPAAPVKVTARSFRGVDERNTFAVMQWYAWPNRGHFAPGRWFWADQAQQWRQQVRMPWVAVSVLYPIEPVGNIRNHTETVTAIAQAVQQGLLASTFAE